MSRLRIAWKRWLLARGRIVIEFCDICGREVEQVWTSPDCLWLRIVGSQGGIRCIRCFDAECTRRGKLIRWVPRDIEDPLP